MNEQHYVRKYGMSKAELFAWYEDKKDLHPSIGFFPRPQIWYAEIVIGEQPTHSRIVGNGKTLAEAIGECRIRLMEAQSPVTA